MIFNAEKESKDWETELREEVECLNSRPVMAVVVAKDFYPPSNIYINNKKKTNNNIGIDTEIFEIDWVDRDYEDVYEQLRDLIYILNKDKNINGIVIQRPFLNFTEEMLDIVVPEKDIDGLGVVQQGFLSSNSEYKMIPATAMGVIKSIQSKFGKDLSGLTISVVNRSSLIGVPLQSALRSLNATVVNLHTKSDKLFTEYMLKNSDIVITATGRRAVYNSSHFSEKVKMIIDCSMDRVDGIPGVGDIDQENVLANMPNCILSSGYKQTGLMTCMALSHNLVKAYTIQNK